MDSIADIAKNRTPSEPPQIAALKEYALEKHGIDISVFKSARNYLIRVPSGAVAQKFRLETLTITKICNLDLPLVIHIG